MVDKRTKAWRDGNKKPDDRPDVAEAIEYMVTFTKLVSEMNEKLGKIVASLEYIAGDIRRNRP